MKATISKVIGYLFLVFSLSLVVTVVLLSVKDANATPDIDIWILVILIIVYLASLLLAFWKQFIAGLVLLSAGLLIGFPNAIINIWGGLIFGLSPLIAGTAFLLAHIFSNTRKSGSS